MKKIIFLIFYCAPIVAMHPELKDAIEHSDLQKVKKILQQSKEQAALSEQNRLITQPVDLEQAHQLAQRLIPEKEEAIQSLNNFDCYRRITISLLTFAATWGPLGYSAYKAFSTGNWPSGQQALLALAAATGGAYHGAEHVRLGLSNRDAKNKHANHLAITQLIAQAKEKAHQTAP